MQLNWKTKKKKMMMLLMTMKTTKRAAQVEQQDLSDYARESAFVSEKLDVANAVANAVAML